MLKSMSMGISIYTRIQMVMGWYGKSSFLSKARVFMLNHVISRPITPYSECNETLRNWNTINYIALNRL